MAEGGTGEVRSGFLCLADKRKASVVEIMLAPERRSR
jgi:hypothetical protein